MGGQKKKYLLKGEQQTVLTKSSHRFRVSLQKRQKTRLVFAIGVERERRERTVENEKGLRNVGCKGGRAGGERGTGSPKSCDFKTGEGNRRGSKGVEFESEKGGETLGGQDHSQRNPQEEEKREMAG